MKLLRPGRPGKRQLAPPGRVPRRTVVRPPVPSPAGQQDLSCLADAVD